MNPNQTTMSPEFRAATQSLAETLVASQPFVDHEQAYRRLEANQTSTDLLNRMWASQAELRERQQQGRLQQSDIDALRQIEKEVQADSLIIEFAQAQTNAAKLLREVNREISERIGLDFASLARRSCG